MIQQILDLHIHSKYSRACSPQLELPIIGKTCETRGIDVVVTGDCTHPAWFSDIKEQLKETNEGIFSLKDGSSRTKFMIGTEVASIKKHKDKTRRVHLLLFFPSIESTETFNKELDRRNINRKSDGRPIIGMTSKDILQMMLEIDERAVMIPAHAWTPWFAVFGSKGGYDTLEECFEELTPHIFAIETGLSSDPLMNAHLSMLDNIALISNSDAHSPQKLGREANVFSFETEQEVTYTNIMHAIKQQDPTQFLRTIEFYPEEGKYHYDGHRDCNVVLHPQETKKHKGICPVCKRALTIGVMHRVDDLADRTGAQAKIARRIPYTSVVPLPEILADTFGVGVATKRVQAVYDTLITSLGSEFFILLDCPLKDIEVASSKEVAIAIDRVRQGTIVITPGYDGVFGTVKVFEENERTGVAQQILF